MARDAVPDRSRAAPPDLRAKYVVFRTIRSFLYLFHAYQTYFFFSHSRASRVVLFRSQICVILLQSFSCSMS